MAEPQRLLVVSHPAVLAVNQLPYELLRDLGWTLTLVVPARWRHEYATGTFSPERHGRLGDQILSLPVILAGRPQRHLYLTRPSAVLRRTRPDIAFLEAETFSLAALQWGHACGRMGVPFGVQAAENLDRRLPLPARAIQSRVLQRAAFVAARSPRAAELIESLGALGLVGVAPHGVPAWQQQAPSGPRPFTVGYAGRLVPEKGIGVLLAAVSRVEGARLLIVGDGPLRQEVENATGIDVELRTNVAHDDMARAFADMDVLALPSLTTPRWTEQFGRVLVEALWCGVPVVGSDSGEIPWVIETTGGGLVFAEGDARSLADALTTMRDDPALRARLAANGRRVVEERFSVDASARALDGLLRGVARAA